MRSEYELLFKEHGLGITSFSPLKGGILTGKYAEEVPEDIRVGKSQDKYIVGLTKTQETESSKKEMGIVKSLKGIEGLPFQLTQKIRRYTDNFRCVSGGISPGMGAEKSKYFECNHGCIKARAGVQERQGLGSAAEVDG